MAPDLVLLVLLLLAACGLILRWPCSRSLGYVPSGALGLSVIVVLVLLLTGRI